MFAQCVVLTTLLVAVLSFTIQQDPGTRECTDLICPKGAFAKIAHPLIDDDKRETQCTVCSQCTENGYSVCGTPLNKHPRLRRSPYTAGCSCANFVPEGCVIRWAAQNAKSSDTEAIHVCYLSTLRTPPQPEATPNENGTLLMLEAFWERPYWKEFNLTDLFLYIEFEAPGSGNSSRLETHSMQIDMSDDSVPVGSEPNPEYDPTDFFAQTDEESEEDEPVYQPIQFNHDAFQDVPVVRFYYNVTVDRPRQLNLRRDAYRIEDISTSVSSESLIYDVNEALGESDESEQDAEDDFEEDAPVKAKVTTSTTTTSTAKTTTTPTTTEKPKQKPTVEMVDEEEFDESEEDDDDEILDEEDEEDPIDDGVTSKVDEDEDDDSDDVDEDESTTEADDVETTTYTSEESEEATSTDASVEESTEGSPETVEDILLDDDNVNANETIDFFQKHLGGAWDLTRVCFVLAGVFSIILCIAACCYYYRGCCYSDQQKVVTKTSNGYEYHVTGNGQEMEPLTKAVKYGITEGSATANQHIIDENILDATIKELQGIAEAAESNHHDNPIQYHNDPNSDSSPEIQTYKQIVQSAPCLWPCRLRIDGLVGTGTFGNINRGLMIDADQRSSINVFVLSIKKIELFNIEERKSIVKSLLNSVQAGTHPNVVSLLAVQQQPDRLLVVLDDMFHPDLLAVLRESRAVRFDPRVQKQVVSTLSSVHLIDIMLGCAEGCGHLIKQGITHPMLAACNVLVAGRTTVKISGFALANHRLLHQKQFEARPTKQRWQAPEYHVRECADPTCGQSNIWSLGVLIWEIMALGGTPYAQYPTQEAFLSRIREKRAKLLPLEYCSAELNSLVELCCTYDRNARPDMTDIVVKKLTNIKNGPEDPIHLTVDNVEFIYPRVLPSLEQIVARL